MPFRDEFHRHQDRRAIVEHGRDVGHRADGGRGDDRGPAEEAGDDGGLRMRAAFGLAETAGSEAALQGGRAAAHEVEHRRDFGPRRVQPGRPHHFVPDQRVKRMVVAVEDEDGVVSEEGFQPVPDAAARPVRVEGGAHVLDGGLRGGDALDLAQHALALAAQGAREHQPLMLDGDVVGALGRGQHGDHDADDGDGDDDADRDHHAQAGAVPIGISGLLGSAPTRSSRQAIPPKTS